MAVQFLCPACSQPIEVDDEWSARPVACPYCRKTVTAPKETTFQPDSVAPQASPIGSPPHIAGSGELAQVGATPAGTLIARCALGLAGAAFASYLVCRMTFLPRLLEFVGPDATPQEAQRAIMEQTADGTMPGWLLYGSLLFLASLAMWVAGLVCGIIAVAKSQRRGMAIASLLISGLTMLLCCVGPNLGG